MVAWKLRRGTPVSWGRLRTSRASAPPDRGSLEAIPFAPAAPAKPCRANLEASRRICMAASVFRPAAALLAQPQDLTPWLWHGRHSRHTDRRFAHLLQSDRWCSKGSGSGRTLQKSHFTKIPCCSASLSDSDGKTDSRNYFTIQFAHARHALHTSKRLHRLLRNYFVMRKHAIQRRFQSRGSVCARPSFYISVEPLPSASQWASGPSGIKSRNILF